MSEDEATGIYRRRRFGRFFSHDVCVCFVIPPNLQWVRDNIFCSISPFHLYLCKCTYLPRWVMYRVSSVLSLPAHLCFHRLPEFSFVIITHIRTRCSLSASTGYNYKINIYMCVCVREWYICATGSHFFRSHHPLSFLPRKQRAPMRC